ncbi:MAG: Xaa-Pro peptidase family protein [Chloroflexota bacterium]|nr:Xaa-Pro peptidase family protein [Chloroflexota bacterium]
MNTSPHATRVEKLRGLMQKQGIDFLVLFDPVNQYYISGASQTGTLVLPMNAPPVYLVRRNLEKAKNDSWLGDVRQLGGFEKSMSAIATELGIANCVVGIEFNLTSVSLHLRTQRVFQGIEFADCGPLMLEARKIKDPGEIASLREAVRCTDRVFGQVPAIFREGITEIDLAAEIDCFMRKQGSEGITIFYDFGGRTVIWKPGYSRVVSGAHATIPSDYPIVGGPGLSKSASHGPSRKKIERGEQVTVDMGTIIEGYHADIGRTFFVGEPSPKLRDMYDAVLHIQTVFIENARPGVTIAEAVNKALAAAEQRGYLSNLMGPPPLNHTSIGHGVGLYTNELPLLTPKNKDTFEPGMTYAVEPKVVVPGIGSVEVEDTLLVTEERSEVLSQTPKTIESLIL